MKMQKSVAAIFIILCFSFIISCKMAEIRKPDDYSSENYIKYHVSGRNGIQIFSPKIKFGIYSAAITTSDKHISEKEEKLPTDWSFKSILLRKADKFYSIKKAEEKTNIKITIGSDNWIASLSHIESRISAIEKDSKSVTTTYELAHLIEYSGIVKSDNSDEWKFTDKDKREYDEQKESIICKNNKYTITIKKTNYFEGTNYTFGDTITGYYLYNGTDNVAIVDNLNDGTVYIKKDIPTDLIPGVINTVFILYSYSSNTKKKVGGI